MRITGLDIKQFMRVDSVHMEFDESGAISIGGENGSGKTSVEKFIETCFGGKDKCPQMPVKIGAKKAMGRIQLDDDGRSVTIDVEIGINKGFKATVRQDGGLPISSPASMLRSLVSKFTFNPFELMKLRGKDQRRVMLDCMEVDFDDLDEKSDEIKAKREVVGRDQKGRERQIELLPLHYNVPEKEIKTSEVATELQDAMNHNAKCKDFMEAVEEWEEARDDSEENVKKVEAKFLQIKAKLELAHQELQDNIIGLNESIKDANKLFRVDIDPIQKKMDEIDDTNSKVRANKTRSDLQEQYEQDHDSFEELGDELDKIEAKKQDRLNNAECPVEDLEFRDDGVWYQGLPLDQDMESDQMIKCVQLASALNPELKTICIDNGERMLPAKLKELDEWAEANDYQILIFRASDSSEGCEFYLEEGKIKDE